MADLQDMKEVMRNKLKLNLKDDEKNSQQVTHTDIKLGMYSLLLYLLSMYILSILISS